MYKNNGNIDTHEQRRSKQKRTEHPHVSVQTVYTNGRVAFGKATNPDKLFK